MEVGRIGRHGLAARLQKRRDALTGECGARLADRGDVILAREVRQ